MVPYVGVMKCRSRLTRYWTKEILSDLSETIQVIAMTLVIYWECNSVNYFEFLWTRKCVKCLCCFDVDNLT